MGKTPNKNHKNHEAVLAAKAQGTRKGVTTECLLIMAARFEPEFLAGRSEIAVVMYLYRVRRRYRLSIRRITHRGTQKRIEMGYSLEESNVVPHILGDTKFASVHKMDQTAVYIDMNPNTTIDFVGVKHVDIVQELLFFCAHDNLCWSRRHYCGGRSATKPVASSSCYSDSSEKKEFCSESRMLYWIDEMFLFYSFVLLVWKPAVSGSRFLLLDSLKPHKMGSVRQELEEECSTEVDFIPPGITGVAQPMNVSAMRVFKKRCRELYVAHHIDNDFSPDLSAHRGLITRIVVQAWSDVPSKLY
ncbi:DDE superfamily endonuclease domain [Phytophthora cactorum]|nr:DDE superfamily endonuclease domain [Phytophthora cactorum]